MGFFWSGRNASVERIFKRSARYWITTYVGNCLWGPPGRRGRRKEAKPAFVPRTPEQLAYDIGVEVGEEGTRKGWSRAKMEHIAHNRLAAALDAREAAHRPSPSPRQPFRSRPAGIHPSGGLRGGAAKYWAAHRYT